MTLRDLIPPEALASLRETGRRIEHDSKPDIWPVVRLYMPDGPAVWLVAAIRDDDRSLFALADLGVGTPELGWVNSVDILDIRGALGLTVERDTSFAPKRSLEEYARAAYAAGRLVT